MGLKLDTLQAFVFDLDDTLINWRAAERHAFEKTVATHLAPAGVELAQADHHYQKVLYENFLAFRKTGRWWYARDRLGRLVELLNLKDIDPDRLEATFRSAVDHRLDFLEGTQELLGALRAQGFKTGLLTNGPAPFQRQKFSRLGIDHHFDYVGISGEIGHWKPDPAAFHHVLNQLGVAPHQAAMVGDSLHFDIEPARALGLQTVWMDTHHEADPAQGNFHASDTAASADLVVPTPAELARRVAARP